MSSKRVSLKGKGADLFFGDYTPESQPVDDDAPPITPSAPELDGAHDLAEASGKVPRKRPTRARQPASGSESLPESNQASTLASQPSRKTTKALSIDQASTLASPESETDDRPDPNRSSAAPPSKPLRDPSRHGRDEISDVEAVRRVVKTPGREVSFIRLTPEEKAQVADIVYAYKRKGQKTSETEIHRIALNFLLNDFHLHDAESLLARTLAALSA